MTSPSGRTDGALRRHDLVVVSRAAWQSLLAERRDLAGEPVVAGWVDRGWPLIVRRPMPGEGDGLALGLPLPPSHGKRRLALSLPFAAMVSTAPPPLLSLAVDVARRRRGGRACGIWWSWPRTMAAPRGCMAAWRGI